MKRFFSFAAALFFVTVLAHPSYTLTPTSRPLVSNIKARAFSTNKIELSWTLPSFPVAAHISALLIYRDTKPISSLEGLEHIAILTYSSHLYIDSPQDFLEYYYAVVSVVHATSAADSGAKEQRLYTEHDGSVEELYYDEELDAPFYSVQEGSAVYNIILPGVNATVDGVRIAGIQESTQSIRQKQLEYQTEEAQKKQYKNDELREQPLPYITLLPHADIRNAEEKSAPRAPAISASSEANVKKLLNANSPIQNARTPTTEQLLELYIFEQDIISPESGDEYLLFEVLKSSFIQENFTKAISDLRAFLAQNRNEAVTNRAHFYLGEAYYFLGRLPEALNQFLLLQETYPALTRKWIESTLDLYHIPEF